MAYVTAVALCKVMIRDSDDGAYFFDNIRAKRRGEKHKVFSSLPLLGNMIRNAEH
jgi:hypothetical protein